MRNEHALFVTAQALSITSQLLAIGIEVTMLAGGYFLVRRLKREFEIEEEEHKRLDVDPATIQVQAKSTWKDWWKKTKKIVRALNETA